MLFTPVDPMSKGDINYTKEAFLNPWNLGFLIMAMVSAFFLINVGGSTGPSLPYNIMLIMTAALELIYLGIMPRQERFRRVVRAQRAKEHAKPPTQKEIYAHLKNVSQRRYIRLRKAEKEIESNYRKLSYTSQGLLDSHIKKIDGLLDSYLNLLYQKERYDDSQQSGTEHDVTTAMAELQAELENLSPRLKAIKKRRMRILEQRLERFKRSKENLQIIEAQLDTIDDVVKYIHEQSLTLRDPEAITFQLDTLLSEVEETEATVIEMQELESPSLDVDILGDMDSYDSESLSDSSSDRIKE